MLQSTLQHHEDTSSHEKAHRSFPAPSPMMQPDTRLQLCSSPSGLGAASCTRPAAAAQEHALTCCSGQAEQRQSGKREAFGQSTAEHLWTTIGCYQTWTQELLYWLGEH
ncbi:uncharacterized protein LOC144059114 [Vanacampus margaritifer]